MKSSSLRKPEYLIHFRRGQRGRDVSKVIFWDGEMPVPLGHPTRYILQRKNEKILVRTLESPEHTSTPLRSFDFREDLFGKSQSLSDRSPENFIIKRLVPIVAMDPSAVAKVPRLTLVSETQMLPEDALFQKQLKKFGIAALIIMLAILLFRPSEPVSPNEDLIPKKFAKLIMNKPKEKLQAPSAGGATQSQAQVKAIARAFQSKAVQKSIQSMLKGGLSKYSVMTTGKSIQNLSNAISSAVPVAGTGTQKKASDILAGSHVGATQIGADKGYGSGSGVNVTGQGRGQFDIGLNTADASVDEGLTKEEVAKVIHAHLNEIRYCYESAILKDPNLAGKVLIDFTINGGGLVSKATTGEGSLRESNVSKCLAGKLRTWKFPQPRGGVNVAVSYPFIFKSVSR